MQEYDLQFVHVFNKQLVIADEFSRISHFRFSAVEKFEYTFLKFVVMSIIMLTDEKKKWKKYLTKK